MFNKQSIKQFLKPNKKKILVFAVLGIILLFIPLIPCQIYHGGTLPPDEYGRFWTENLMCSPLSCALDSNTGFIVFPRYGMDSTVCPWSLIASIYILFYILSCFVIYFYDKIKFRKL